MFHLFRYLWKSERYSCIVTFFIDHCYKNWYIYIKTDISASLTCLIKSKLMSLSDRLLKKLIDRINNWFIVGVAFIFNQKFFNDLNAACGISLENIVYYKGKIGNNQTLEIKLWKFWSGSRSKGDIERLVIY